MRIKNSIQKTDKPIKIIIIGTFNPNKPDYHSSPDEDLYYVATWGGLWARRIKKRYSDLDVEVWRPEPEFRELKQRKAFGLDCTIFPAKHFVISKTVTLEMLKQLFRYNLNFNLIIHKNTLFDWQFNIMMPILFPKAKIVLSHHGGVFPFKSGLKWRLKRKLLKFSYKKIDSVTYLRAAAREFIECSNNRVKQSFLPVGANFNQFKPLDKLQCRKKLDLPLDFVLAVYVGKFYRLKGVDHILKVFHRFKDKNFSVLFVGGSKTDELYLDVSRSGCPFWGYVNHDLLREIYSAADFYIHPAFHPEFGGFDVSLIECMACNRPVLSSQLSELDFDYSELGLLIDNEKNIISKSENMISQFGDFTKCRDAAINHLDGNTAIIDKLYRVYTQQ